MSGEVGGSEASRDDDPRVMLARFANQHDEWVRLIARELPKIAGLLVTGAGKEDWERGDVELGTRIGLDRYRMHRDHGYPVGATTIAKGCRLPAQQRRTSES